MTAPGPPVRRRQAKLARSVGESPTQVMPSRQPGSECCVRSGCVGCVIEPRNGYVAGAETVQSVERNTDRAAKRGHRLQRFEEVLDLLPKGRWRAGRARRRRAASVRRADVWAPPSDLRGLRLANGRRR